MRQNTLCSFQKNCRSFILIVLSVCIAFTLIFPHPVEASTTPQLRKLTKGKTYTAYDVTGDGKADRVKAAYNRVGTAAPNSADLYINGKLIQRIEFGRSGALYILAPKKNQAFFAIYTYPFNSTGLEIAQFRNGSLRSLNKNVGVILDKREITKVSKNRITVVVSSGRHDNSYFAEGKGASFTLYYNIIGNKIRLKSRYGAVTGGNEYTALESFTTASRRSHVQTDGPFVAAGQTVYLKQVYIPENNIPVYEISVNGETGWINEKSTVGSFKPLLERVS